MKKLLLIVVFLSSFSVLNAGMKLASNDEKLVVDSILKPNPRLWYSTERLVFLKDAYQNKADPHYTALKKMVGIAASTLAKTPEPYHGSDSVEWRISATNDSKVTVCLAVAYHITGDKKYMQKAIEIITARQRQYPDDIENLEKDTPGVYANVGLNLVCGSAGMILTYDMLYNEKGFSNADKALFEKWTKELVPCIKEDVRRWNTPYKQVAPSVSPTGWLETKDPRDIGFGGQYYQNHCGENMTGLLEIGYALGDIALVQYALDSDENPRDLKEMIDGAIHIEGDTDFMIFERRTVEIVGKKYGKDIATADWYIMPPQTGEIYDRYRSISGHGIGYSKHGFQLLLMSAELAYQNGIDFYSYTGDDGENLLLPFDFYKDFILTGDTSIKGGYYIWCEMKKGYEGFAQLYELGIRRYPEHKQMFQEVLSMPEHDRKNVSLYPVHTPNLSWLIAFGE